MRLVASRSIIALYVISEEIILAIFIKNLIYAAKRPLNTQLTPNLLSDDGITYR